MMLACWTYDIDEDISIVWSAYFNFPFLLCFSIIRTLLGSLENYTF